MRTTAVGLAAFALWGGEAVVLTTDAGAADAAAALVRDETSAMDEACGRFRPDSELAQVNGPAGGAVAVSPLFGEAVSAALQAAAAADGAVDPTCGAGLEAAGYDHDIETLRGGGARFIVREHVSARGWRAVGFAPGAVVRVHSGGPANAGSLPGRCAGTAVF